jgi:hypothetical protein
LTPDNREAGMSHHGQSGRSIEWARPCARGLKPGRAAGSAGAAERSGAALILVRRNSASESGCVAGPVLRECGRVQADGADGGPVPIAFGAVLDDETHGVDVDLA